VVVVVVVIHTFLTSKYIFPGEVSFASASIASDDFYFFIFYFLFFIF